MVLIPVSPNQRHLAQMAGGNLLPGLGEVRPASLLGAGLHHPLRVAHRRDQRLSLVDGVSDRLFTVGIFARLERIEKQRHVPVDGRANHDGVYIFPVENLAVVGVVARLGRVFGSGLQTTRFVDVADGHDLVRFDLVEQAQQELAAFSGPDCADPDPVVGAENPAVRNGRDECRTHKLPAAGDVGQMHSGWKYTTIQHAQEGPDGLLVQIAGRNRYPSLPPSEETSTACSKPNTCVVQLIRLARTPRSYHSGGIGIFSAVMAAAHCAMRASMVSMPRNGIWATVPERLSAATNRQPRRRRGTATQRMPNSSSSSSMACPSRRMREISLAKASPEINVLGV